MSKTNPLDVQVGGDHYKKVAIQPIEYVFANNLGFVEGSIVKYITRWRDKGGVQDLEKIKHYVDLLIHETTRNESSRAEAAPSGATEKKCCGARFEKSEVRYEGSPLEKQENPRV